ncbi:hypothetical protein ACLKA6_012667 [Drosophila palustris]
MKFGKTFESYLTTEWRQQYMNYTELKEMIREAVNEAPSSKDAPLSVILEYFENFEGNFFAACHEELTRVQDFYAQKLAEARRKVYTMEIQLNASQSLPNQRSPNTRSLGLACSEFYLSLIMLQNFQSLNYTAFRKICKKYDKNFKSVKGAQWFEENVSQAPFAKDQELKSMIIKVEELYTLHLTNGDRAKAMAKLRVPPMGERLPPSQVFLAGVVLGLFIVSAVIILISLYFIRDKLDLIDVFVRLYRGPIASGLASFLFALNVYVWQSKGINHVLIFNIDLRNHMQATSFLEFASTMSFISTMSMILFIHHKEFEVNDPHYFPMICIVLPLLLLINPIRIMNRPARMWILRVIGRIFAAPFYGVIFPDFWLADQFTSMTLCMVDYFEIVRFYIRYFRNSDNAFEFEPDYWITVVRVLPPWFRLAQCLRRYYDNKFKYRDHLLNAIKYGIGIIVITFSCVVMETSHKYKHMFDNPWIWCYIAAIFISTVYSCVWDLVCDFGLFKIWKGENIFLRENLIYPKGFYYFAIVSNVLLRFVWALELYLIYFNYLSPFYSKTITSFLEIVRRFIWNFIRLENEHLYNVGHFRAVRDIYLKPISMSEMDVDNHPKTSYLNSVINSFK